MAKIKLWKISTWDEEKGVWIVRVCSLNKSEVPYYENKFIRNGLMTKVSENVDMAKWNLIKKK